MELKFILIFFAMLVSPFDVIRCDIINVKNFREMLRYFVTRIFVPEKANIYLRSALMKNVFKFSLLRQYSFVFSSSLQLKISMKFEKKKKIQFLSYNWILANPRPHQDLFFQDYNSLSVALQDKSIAEQKTQSKGLVAFAEDFFGQYLVGFFIFAEISGIFKRTQLEKLVSPVK